MDKNKGFTIIELIVVIAIIAILAAIVVANVNNFQTKARDTRRIADSNNIRKALEMYRVDNGVYPGDILSTYYWISDNNYYPGSNCSSGGLLPYIKGVCSLKDSSGNPYAYVVFNNGKQYRIGAKFELSNNKGTQFKQSNNTDLDRYYEPK